MRKENTFDKIFAVIMVLTPLLILIATTFSKRFVNWVTDNPYIHKQSYQQVFWLFFWVSSIALSWYLVVQLWGAF